MLEDEWIDNFPASEAPPPPAFHRAEPKDMVIHVFGEHQPATACTREYASRSVHGNHRDRVVSLHTSVLSHLRQPQGVVSRGVLVESDLTGAAQAIHLPKHLVPGQFRAGADDVVQQTPGIVLDDIQKTLG